MLFRYIHPCYYIFKMIEKIDRVFSIKLCWKKNELSRKKNRTIKNKPIFFKEQTKIFFNHKPKHKDKHKYKKREWNETRTKKYCYFSHFCIIKKNAMQRLIRCIMGTYLKYFPALFLLKTPTKVFFSHFLRLSTFLLLCYLLCTLIVRDT